MGQLQFVQNHNIDSGPISGGQVTSPWSTGQYEGTNLPGVIDQADGLWPGQAVPGCASEYCTGVLHNEHLWRLHFLRAISVPFTKNAEEPSDGVDFTMQVKNPHRYSERHCRKQGNTPAKYDTRYVRITSQITRGYMPHPPAQTPVHNSPSTALQMTLDWAPPQSLAYWHLAAACPPRAAKWHRRNLRAMRNPIAGDRRDRTQRAGRPRLPPDYLSMPCFKVITALVGGLRCEQVDPTKYGDLNHRDPS